jgi:hypothetical protein
VVDYGGADRIPSRMLRKEPIVDVSYAGTVISLQEKLRLPKALVRELVRVANDCYGTEEDHRITMAASPFQTYNVHTDVAVEGQEGSGRAMFSIDKRTGKKKINIAVEIELTEGE